MEVFRPVQTAHSTAQQDMRLLVVSILVLMEVFRPAEQLQDDPVIHNNVSILVLMEVFRPVFLKHAV